MYASYFSCYSEQIQGSNYDPEGEYVRHWLPELARVPTEWIHHPWDAPLTVLKSAGVELGQNYPKPIIDIDLARERLTEAIFLMWEKDAATWSANANGTNEEVVDNSDRIEKVAIAKVCVKENFPCPASSSHDQRVPTFQNSRSGLLNRKRTKCIKDERPSPNNPDNYNHGCGTSIADEDLHSTAESSSAKKQATSRTSFSVPQSYSSSSNGNPLQEYESSGQKQPWPEQIVCEKTSSKDGE